jgi:hypothetical protein
MKWKNTIKTLLGPADPKLKWKPIYQVTFTKGGREVVKDLELDLDYFTTELRGLDWYSPRSGLMPGSHNVSKLQSSSARVFTKRLKSCCGFSQ